MAYELLTLAQRQPAAPSRGGVARAHVLARSSWPRTTRCSPTTGPRADDPDKAVTYLERAGRPGAAQRCVPGGAAVPDRSALEVRGRRAPTRPAPRSARRASAPRTTSSATSSRAAPCLATRGRAARPRPFPSSRLGVDARRSLSAVATQAAHLLRPGRYRERRRADEGADRRGARLLQDARSDRLPRRRAAAGPPLRHARRPQPRRGGRAVAAPRPHADPRGRRRQHRRADEARRPLRRAGDRDGRRGGPARGGRVRVEHLGRDPRPPRRLGARRARRTSGARAARRGRRLQPRGRGVADALGDPHLLRATSRAAESAWTATASWPSARATRRIAVLVAARRGADARRARRDRRRRPRARRRAGHPDGGERRQQHDREALRHRDRPRRAGPATTRRSRRPTPSWRSSPRQPPSAFHYVEFCAGAVRGLLRRAGASAGDRAAALLRKARRGCRVVRRVSRSPSAAFARGAGCCRACSSGQRGRARQALRAWQRAEATAARDGHALRARPRALRDSRVTAGPAPSEPSPRAAPR